MSARKIFSGCSWRYNFEVRSFFLFYQGSPIGVYYANAKQFCINETLYNFLFGPQKHHVVGYVVQKYIGENYVSTGWMRDEEIVFLNAGTMQSWIEN